MRLCLLAFSRRRVSLIPSIISFAFRPERVHVYVLDSSGPILTRDGASRSMPVADPIHVP